MRLSRTILRAASIVLVCFVTLVSGCSVFNRQLGDPIDGKHAGFEERETTVHDVIAALGPPLKLSNLPDGMVMLYEYAEISERQLGLNLDFADLGLLKFSTGRGNIDREALVLVFDQRGVLQAHRYASWADKPARGSAVQLFFVAVPTVKVDYFLEKPEQHGWGAGLLESLPATLNAGHSVRSGEHGLELRGTPKNAGQRTLEMGRVRR